MKPPCLCAVWWPGTSVSEPGSELLSSQKEAQWSLPACPTRAGDIRGNLSLSCSSFCEMSAGSWIPFGIYPGASFRPRMLTLDLGSLPLQGASMFPRGPWNILHPVHSRHQPSLALDTKDKKLLCIMALCKNEKKQKEERRPLSHQSGPPHIQTTQEPQALVGLKVLALEETEWSLGDGQKPAGLLACHHGYSAPPWYS